MREIGTFESGKSVFFQTDTELFACLILNHTNNTTYVLHAGRNLQLYREDINRTHKIVYSEALDLFPRFRLKDPSWQKMMTMMSSLA